MELKLLRVRETSGDVLSTSDAVSELMRDEAKADRECFWVLHLSTANRVIEKELVSMGTLDCSLVHPREVFKRAVLNGASGIITVHNHPGCSCKPSNADKEIWDILDRAGRLLDIEVLDHMIITPNGYCYSQRGTN